MATVKKDIPHVKLRGATYYFNKLMADPAWSKRLIALVRKSCGQIDNKKLWQIMSKRGKDSTKINEILRIAPPPKPTPADEERRAAGRAAQILQAVPKATRYVDFGCGDRTITEAVGRAYGLAPNHIIGVDIFDSGRPGSRFVNDLTEIEPGVDLITCFVSLHHTSFGGEIAKMSRIISPNGVVIIREHDVTRDELMWDYLQAVHIVAAAWDTAGDLKEILDSVSYRSRAEWTSEFDLAGFKYSKLLQWSPEHNPQRLFYMAFSKQPLDDVKPIG